MFTAEGKAVAFAPSGNTRAGWKAEMVRVLRTLVKRAVKVQQTVPTDHHADKTRAFHTLLAPLAVNGRVYTAKITLREALSDPNARPHKFYDIAALEMENGPEVSGVASSLSQGPVQPTPSGPLTISVSRLVTAVKGIDLTRSVSQVVDEERRTARGLPRHARRLHCLRQGEDQAAQPGRILVRR